MQNLTKISQQEFDPLPKILIYDLEVSATLGWTYGLWKTNVLKVERDPEIMCFSYQWFGEKDIYHVSQRDMSEKKVVKKLWDLFDEADILVAHNGRRFDQKVSNAMFIRHHLTPPSPYKTVDTLQVARSVARFNSNSLDSLGKLLLGEGKTESTYADVWYNCLIKNDKEAWATMEKYNNKDVEVLAGLYAELRPWIHNHPNIGDHTGIDGICPKCGSDNIRKDGSYRKRSGRVQRYKCLHCGGWSSEASVKKEGRLVNV